MSHALVFKEFQQIQKFKQSTKSKLKFKNLKITKLNLLLKYQTNNIQVPTHHLKNKSTTSNHHIQHKKI